MAAQKVTSLSDVQKGPQEWHLPHLGTPRRVASGRLWLLRVSHPEPAPITKDPAPDSRVSSATASGLEGQEGAGAGRAAASPAAGLQEAGTSWAVLT